MAHVNNQPMLEERDRQIREIGLSLLLPESFGSKEELKFEKARRIGLLRDTGSPEASKVADKLSACSLDQPSGSSASPTGNPLFEAFFPRDLFSDLGHRSALTFVSIVVHEDWFETGHVFYHDPRRANELMRGTISHKSPYGTAVIGTTDCALRIAENGNPYWQGVYRAISIDNRISRMAWAHMRNSHYNDVQLADLRDIRDERDCQRYSKRLLRSRLIKGLPYLSKQDAERDRRTIGEKERDMVEYLLFLDRYPIRSRLLGYKVRMREELGRLRFTLSV